MRSLIAAVIWLAWAPQVFAQPDQDLGVGQVTQDVQTWVIALALLVVIVWVMRTLRIVSREVERLRTQLSLHEQHLHDARKELDDLKNSMRQVERSVSVLLAVSNEQAATATPAAETVEAICGIPDAPVIHTRHVAGHPVGDQQVTPVVEQESVGRTPEPSGEEKADTETDLLADVSPLQRLATLVENGAPASQLVNASRQIADDTELPYHEAARVVEEWLVWLTEKSQDLAGLEGKALEEKVTLWQRRLDYYLWSDPDQVPPFRRQDGDPDFLETELIACLAERLHAEQEHLREFLSDRGIERIEASHGEEFVPGVIERSSKMPEPTRDRDLHDHIFRIEPGEGGYRVDGRVLVPSYARRYEYRPDTSN